jgi:hypothetical protein
MKDTLRFKSTHDLSFEVAKWELSNEFKRFRIGTCHGLWRAYHYSYDILAIDNDQPGNGHFEDVLEWFENSCKRDIKALRMLEVGNKRFAKHLIEKRDFVRESMENYIKPVQLMNIDPTNK